jgi:hypothetical protein
MRALRGHPDDEVRPALAGDVHGRIPDDEFGAAGLLVCSKCAGECRGGDGEGAAAVSAENDVDEVVGASRGNLIVVDVNEAGSVGSL